jgi:cell wall-associated NlpC family hydrolase
MRRRLALILVALLVATLAALVLPAASLASPSISVARAQAHQLQGQVDSLNNRMEIVVERYDAAVQKLAALKASVATSQAQLLRARYALALAHQQLAEQVVIMYKQPTTQYLDVALSVHSFSDLATQLPFFDKLGQQSAATVREIDALKAAVEQRHAQLVTQRTQAQELVVQIAAQKMQIAGSLEQRRQLLQHAQVEVRRLIVQMQQAKAAAAARAAAAALQAAKRAAAAAAATRAEQVQRDAAPPSSPSASSSANGASSASESGSSSASGGGGGSASAISIAQRYLGVPYVWGGASPAGFDCSGLVMYVFAQLGVALPHNAAQQFTHCTPVPRAELQPGDLVFFGSSAATIHHVGIYVGNDTMIDAPCTGEVVQYDTLFGDFYSGGRL